MLWIYIHVDNYFFKGIIRVIQVYYRVCFRVVGMWGLYLLYPNGVFEERRLLHLPVVEQRARQYAVIDLVVVAGVALVAQLPAWAEIILESRIESCGSGS